MTDPERELFAALAAHDEALRRLANSPDGFNGDAAASAFTRLCNAAEACGWKRGAGYPAPVPTEFALRRLLAAHAEAGRGLVAKLEPFKTNAEAFYNRELAALRELLEIGG